MSKKPIDDTLEVEKSMEKVTVRSYKDKGKAVIVENDEEILQQQAPFTEIVKSLTLKTSDGRVFKVEEAVLLQSETIKNLVDDDCADGIIPIPNVTADVFVKVIEYCNKHVNDKKLNKKEKEGLEIWDNEFVDLDRDPLYELVAAAIYLNIEGLVELAAQKFADRLRNKPIEMMREMLGIENDFTPEEEEEIKKKNIWAFQN